MPAALRSGHANCGRANMGCERRPCTLFWLTLQHIYSSEASPWPRVVGATGTVTALYVTRWREVEAPREAPTLAHPCAYVSIQSKILFLASKHSSTKPPSQRAPTQVRLLARIFSPRMWMFNFGPGRILHPAPCLQTGPHVVRHKRVLG